MSVTIKEILMDWLDINEFHNVRIDSKSKAYVDTLTPDEEFYLMAKTNADDGDAVEIHLNLIDKNKTLLKTIELEGHVENEEVKMTLKVEDLSDEHNLDLNAIKEINATLHYEKEKYPTNKVRIYRTLKSKELSDSGELNDIVEGKVAKAYKKANTTTPNSTGDEVKLIQEALQKMKIKIGNDGIDGVFGNDGHNAVMTFQENYKPTYNVHQYTWAEPDGVVGKNTLLAIDEALVSGWRYVQPEISFPLSFIPNESYKEGMRKFGSNRSSGKRKHAGCDLYAPVGSKIYALANGVILEHKSFYLNTNQITIQHVNFVARYGEVKPKGNGIATGLKVGSKVKKGDHIGYVGELIFSSGTSMSMLHLELYSGTETGSLTDRNNTPYQRRADLIDPTDILDKAKNNLPK